MLNSVTDQGEHRGTSRVYQKEAYWEHQENLETPDYQQSMMIEASLGCDKNDQKYSTEKKLAKIISSFPGLINLIYSDKRCYLVRYTYLNKYVHRTSTVKLEKG